MFSMTGFGSHFASDGNVEIEVSLRCLNGRYFEPRLQIPREYHPFESEIVRLVGQSIRRGTVNVFVSRRLKPGSSWVRVKPNAELAKKWLSAYRSLARQLKISESSGVDHLLKNPDVIEISTPSTASPKEKSLFFKTLQRALNKCMEERSREGVGLKTSIDGFLNSLGSSLKKLQKAQGRDAELFAERVRGRLKAWIPEAQVDEGRLMQEVAHLVEKGDISEEIHRLSVHLDQFSRLVKLKNPEGKKLDFYCQELLREVNTVGSKIQEVQLTQEVIDMKSTIERLREQVQNIE